LPEGKLAGTQVADHARPDPVIAGRNGHLRHDSKLLGCIQVPMMSEQFVSRTQ
jgi:hypothetical protein